MKRFLCGLLYVVCASAAVVYAKEGDYFLAALNTLGAVCWALNFCDSFKKAE